MASSTSRRAYCFSPVSTSRSFATSLLRRIQSRVTAGLLCRRRLVISEVFINSPSFTGHHPHAQQSHAAWDSASCPTRRVSGERRARGERTYGGYPSRRLADRASGRFRGPSSHRHPMILETRSTSGYGKGPLTCVNGPVPPGRFELPTKRLEGSIRRAAGLCGVLPVVVFALVRRSSAGPQYCRLLRSAHPRPSHRSSHGTGGRRRTP